MLKERLTSEVAGIILRHVREEKGRLTELSDLCRINRREFNQRGMSKMRLHRLLRILYALSVILPASRFQTMFSEIYAAISDMADEYDYLLLDE